MEITHFELPGPALLTPRIFRDDRGFFSETYNQQSLKRAGIEVSFVQDNHSMSVQPGTIRGLHFQTPPHAQDKLVHVTRGAIFDVAVDLRNGSPTFGQHVAVTLSAENWQQFWVPKGFAHGFCTLEPDTEVIYKVTDYYDPECDMGLAWNDPDLTIEWPLKAGKPVLSDKDLKLPRFRELPVYFRYEYTNARSTA